jgi:hypothetical protein
MSLVNLASKEYKVHRVLWVHPEGRQGQQVQDLADHLTRVPVRAGA